ncbi:protein-L-isoaspartate O-methyltransferase domain-containing protein 1 [Harpegnathos saltator]|uniref:Protein-L-isoaspartate O-methyltransferase domain-containing protein 1 n=1 Tax=Harpegnathos saltator TaxID=610380 RepID=E2BQD4_HARSA|nr:protein-L-isoaspartate O-methyltransferase domain-containing protein 1 [Harpegnathos saltator]XP_025152338.1 protein-L-isoaspartate O-methyltransferase domain-containing protein 1 [Harpegnathos saltator]EFN82098.1 Protein-L-isoaspartate O-methyltransferase domain-containing protein 1 [Harpegnathos saltator]
MGGAVSSGQDNDELVDNLIESGYIKTKKVEQVFRAVDRADYVLSSHKDSAYKDLAWKHGNIHLSAPCVYSEVMEGLSLEPGLSFLNLGSGTGYLSTMAGLLLKQHGTNHGIELHEDCLKYAYDRLEEFKQKSLALNEFDFCEPLFIQGNCLSIIPGRQYDRVYCGAACPESHEAFIKQFVRVGGILVMPYRDNLVRVERVNKNTWMHYTMLPVSFANLIVPLVSEYNLLQLPECNPLSLQELCRGKIRYRLRENIWNEHADLETEKPIIPGQRKPSPQQHTLRRFVIPIFEEADGVLDEVLDEVEEQDYPSALSERRARFLLNVDADTGEAITTTLQLVRAVIQPNPIDAQRENQREDARTINEDTRNAREATREDSHENNREDAREMAGSTSVDDNQHEQKRKSAKKNFCFGTSEGTTTRSSTELADVSNNINETRHEREVPSTAATYSSISESESEQERERAEDIAFVRRHKIWKRKKTDSGIVEDANLSNEESQPSSQSSTSQSSSQSFSTNANHDDSDATDTMDIDLPPISINKPCRNMYGSLSKDSTSNDKEVIGHYVDSNAFTGYMTDKIQQLPLPFSVKLYINYNRKF